MVARVFVALVEREGGCCADRVGRAVGLLDDLREGVGASWSTDYSRGARGGVGEWRVRGFAA